MAYFWPDVWPNLNFLLEQRIKLVLIFLFLLFCISAICLELLFLLHEMEHYHVLAAPLRAFSVGQSAPPLLLASVTTSTLFANPITYLRNMTHDIMRMILKLHELPVGYDPANALSSLESLSLSLSSCIFHSLCGGQEDQLLEAIRKGEVKIFGKENKEGNTHVFGYPWNLFGVCSYQLLHLK